MRGTGVTAEEAKDLIAQMKTIRRNWTGRD